MTRFFVDPARIENGVMAFDGDDSHHITVVLKMRVGDKCIVLDNLGKSLLVVLEQVAKTRVVGRVLTEQRPETEPAVHITVAQALPKMLDKLEWILQHGTEIGVSAFTVFSSVRARAEAGRFDRKLPRWQEIVKTAAEQSERVKLPTVKGIVTYEDVLATAKDFDLALLAYEREDATTLRTAITSLSPRNALVVIGPEGGFADEEVSAARDAGIRSITLGPRILRCETAALSMVSQMLYEFDGHEANNPA